MQAYLNWDMVWDALGARESGARDVLWYRAAVLRSSSNEILISHLKSAPTQSLEKKTPNQITTTKWVN